MRTKWCNRNPGNACYLPVAEGKLRRFTKLRDNDTIKLYKKIRRPKMI